MVFLVVLTKFVAIKWFFLDNELPTSENLIIENVPNNSKLRIPEGKRSDSGIYKIRAVNEWGSDEEIVELVFLGPPSAPKGKWKL